MSLNFKVIFIAGVHGVGKSYFCSEVEKILGLPVYSASKLIKEIKQADVDIDKKVIDVKENQDYLITALNTIQTTSKTILLDGHFCLFSDEGIINVPSETFEKIPLQGIFVLHDAAENIYQRLKARGNTSLSVDMISELQEKEMLQALLVASLVKSPLYKFAFHELTDAMEKISCLTHV